jgi:membrane protein YdbS with pleckstrin-like domain
MDASEPLSRYVSPLQDEKVLMTLRRRYPSIFSSILSTTIAFFLIGGWSALSHIVQYLGHLKEVWTLLYAIVVVVACIFALMALLGYFYVKGHLYILTNRRIVLLRKFITISVRELAYSEITDLIVNQGPLARILNYGSVTPLSPGVRGVYAFPYPYARRYSYARVELKDVSNPFNVMHELFKLTRTNTSSAGI